MNFTSVPIINDSKVQPGWIYIKEESKFYLPKDKVNTKIESSPCLIEVKELPLDLIENLTGTDAIKYWRDDLRYLSKGQSFKMICCLLSRSKFMTSLDKENINFEYASEVYYGFGIMVMLKFYKKYEISLDSIQCILNKWMKDIKICDSDRKDAFENIHSANVYSESLKKKSTFHPLASHAFHEIIDVFKLIRKNDNLESIKAIVRSLPLNVNNCSELMCLKDGGSRKSSRNQTWFRKLLDIGKHVFYADYGEMESGTGNIAKALVSILETNLNKPDHLTTYQMDFCMQQLESLEYKNMGKLSKGNINANSLLHLDVENKNACPDSGTICEIIAVPPIIDQNSINSIKNIVKNDDSKSIAENSNDAKVEQTKLRRDKEAGTRSQVSNVSYECKESSKILDLANVKSGKKNKKDLNSSKDKEKTPTVKKVNLLPAQRSDVNTGLRHHYYYERSTEDSNKKTLLLYGKEDTGKLSLLNLLFHCSQVDENVKGRPIVDVASKIESFSFYHFLLNGASVRELIVIVTPVLDCDVLARLKQLLSNGILNINALGFVVNSRSETLTSEETSFFNFIRSSFGEVSNRHLMTFLTFCDFSRNFAVLEEMKHQSIKSNCTLELYTSDLGLSNASEIDDLGNALIARELKKAKKVFKTLNDMPLLSVKSMKMAQEKLFADNHCTASFNQLVKELEQYANLVDNGKDIVETVQHIWKLARLVLTLQGKETSEGNLLHFMAKVLVDFSSNRLESKMISRCFLLLLFNCPERNFTAALFSTLNYYDAIISPLHVNLDAPFTCSVICGNNEVAQYCNDCKNIHLCARDTSDNYLLHVKCLICKCPAKSHSLWTFQDASILYHSFCEMAVSSLKDLFNDLPRQNLAIHFDLFLDCLNKAFPKFDFVLEGYHRAARK